MKISIRRLWVEWRGFITFIAIMLVFRSAIADWNQVPSGSMEPTLLPGDRIVVDKMAYDIRFPFTLTRIAAWSNPKRGDIVIFPSPIPTNCPPSEEPCPTSEQTWVKRVIGLPGDVVELRHNRLILNGTPAHYRRLNTDELARLPPYGDGSRLYVETIFGNSRMVRLRRSTGGRTNYGPITVPDGRLFLMGDNRDNSNDSRSRLGMVERHRVTGRAFAVAFSLDYDQAYMPRPERFFADLR